MLGQSIFEKDKAFDWIRFAKFVFLVRFPGSPVTTLNKADSSSRWSRVETLDYISQAATVEELHLTSSKLSLAAPLLRLRSAFKAAGAVRTPVVLTLPIAQC